MELVATWTNVVWCWAGGAVAQRVATQTGHGLAGQFALTADLCGPVSHGQALQPGQSSSADVVDEHEAGAVGVGCGQMILALSEGQLAQTEWLGTIRSLSGAVGLEVAQPVADTVRIGAGRVSLDMAQCDAALGGGAHGQQVVNELQQRSRRHAEPLSLVALALEGGDFGRCDANNTNSSMRPICTQKSTVEISEHA